MNRPKSLPKVDHPKWKKEEKKNSQCLYFCDINDFFYDITGHIYYDRVFSEHHVVWYFGSAPLVWLINPVGEIKCTGESIYLKTWEVPLPFVYKVFRAYFEGALYGSYLTGLTEYWDKAAYEHFPSMNLVSKWPADFSSWNQESESSFWSIFDWLKPILNLE